MAFEGLDGAGTTTQLTLLAERLRASGVAVTATKEPSDGPLGAILRDAIEGRKRLDPTSLALAFAADRASHLFDPGGGIVARLERGEWVLCDRYVLSSLAYQPEDGIDRDWIARINAFAVEPDVTVFVRTDLDRCVARIAARGDEHELFHSRERLRGVGERYREELGGGRWLGELVLVDGNPSIAEVAREIWSRIAAGLSLPGSVRRRL